MHNKLTTYFLLAAIACSLAAPARACESSENPQGLKLVMTYLLGMPLAATIAVVTGATAGEVRSNRGAKQNALDAHARYRQFLNSRECMRKEMGDVEYFRAIQSYQNEIARQEHAANFCKQDVVAAVKESSYFPIDISKFCFAGVALTSFMGMFRSANTAHRC